VTRPVQQEDMDSGAFTVKNWGKLDVPKKSDSYLVRRKQTADVDCLIRWLATITNNGQVVVGGIIDLE